MTAEPSPLRDLQFRLEHVALRLITGPFRVLPLDTAARFSAWWWRRLAPIFSPKRHERALDNLKIAFPEKTDEERLAICLAHWENLGRIMVETIQIDKLIAAGLVRPVPKPKGAPPRPVKARGTVSDLVSEQRR